MTSHWCHLCRTKPSSIEFKPLHSLVHDLKYDIGWYPLERPRQQTLDEFETISRDYCIVTSPGKASWQGCDIERNLDVQIFHTDTAKIPTKASLERSFGQKHTFTVYLRPWYLQGITFTNVDMALKRHFGLSIPLSSESTAGQWIPAVTLLNVEVNQDVWEDRLALFFDGNLETSVQTMQFGVYTRQKINIKELRERFLSLWRSRWETQNSNGHCGLEIPGNVSLSSLTAAGPVSPIHLDLPVSKPRGRHRRALRRQMQRVSQWKPVVVVDDELAISLQSSPPAVSISRGRLRRRERRKNKTSLVNLDSTGKGSADENSNHPRAQIPPEGSDGDTWWRFNTGEIGLRDQNSKPPVALSIRFGERDRNKAQDTHFENLNVSSEMDFQLSKEIPLISIRPLPQFDQLVSEAKRFHVISYCNRPFQTSGKNSKLPGAFRTTEKSQSMDSSKTSSDQISAPKGEQRRDGFSDIENCAIHVADFIDEAGFISAENWYHNKGFISVIESDPWRLEPFGGTPFEEPLSPETPPSKFNRDQYWHKFSVLICSFAFVADFRKLPYSPGYGVDHSNPDLVYRHNRWGYLDVDNVCPSSRRPRWRAAWSFEFLNQNSERCECAWTEVAHDLNTCRYMDNEMIIYRYESWSRLSNETLSDLPRLVRRPYETFLGLNSHLLTSAEMKFAMGVYYLMGLGVRKDINAGIECMVSAGMEGSLRAMAMVSSLATAYNVRLDLPESLLETWLCKASQLGSRIALRGLNQRFPAKHIEILAVNNTIFDFHHPTVFNYTRDVLPYFDMEDIPVFSRQLEAAKLNLKRFNSRENQETRPTFDGTLNAMAILPKEENNYTEDFYYIFGSLLHLAALFGYRDAIPLLLDAGLDVDGQSADISLRTPLLCALNRGHSDIAKLLIRRGASCRQAMRWTSLFWSSRDEICSTPSPLHYLVNIENDAEATELARLLVQGGADINCKCDIEHLKGLIDYPVLKGKSVTPLRWAILHEKVQLTKCLLSLGAKFAYETYLRPSQRETSQSSASQKGCLLLETPCTSLEILEMFFARARVPGIPAEFSQTPLGLLVSEDDGPERRLRLGFEHSNKILDALKLLLDLQPGYEDILLWSAMRHDHIDIVKYLLAELGWSVESRWKGMSCLHTAVLYGRTDLVKYLLSHGANAAAITESRHLTCLHLLMLVPRNPQTDQIIFESLRDSNIDVNATEEVDGLTALHLAVRNQKLQMTRELLRIGADPSVAVSDQLHLLSQGKGGFLEKSLDQVEIFTKNLTILGEVVIQYIQDGFYDISYVADLIVIFLDSREGLISNNVLIIDRGTNISLLHLLAVIADPQSQRRSTENDFLYRSEPLPDPISADISLLQLALLRTPADLVNLRDHHGDTPLHYACAARKPQNIQTLLSFGANPQLQNSLSLSAVEVLAWSVIFLGPKTMEFAKASKSWHPNIIPRPDATRYQEDPQPKRVQHPANDLSSAFSLLADLGLTIDERLRRLVMAWEFAVLQPNSMGSYPSTHYGTANSFELVPEASAKGIADVEPDTYVDYQLQIKRPYLLATLTAPEKKYIPVYRSETQKQEDKAVEIKKNRDAL